MKHNQTLVIRVLIFISVCFATEANAILCDDLYNAINEAGSNLKKATTQLDFDSAQFYARRAKNALDDASISAMDCGCNEVFAELDNASTKAKRAQNSFDVDDFLDNINKSINSYNIAISGLKLCNSIK